MVLRKLAVALLSVGVMLPGLGHALAVRDVQTKSALGEPFQAEVELAELGDLNADEIKVSLATQEDFERLGIERVYFLTDLRFDVVVNQAGRSYIRVTTSKPVREPYLDFVVRIAWPGNARLQNVTALLDPPVVSDSGAGTLSQAVSSAPVVTPATVSEPPAAVIVEPVVSEPLPVPAAPAVVRQPPPRPVVTQAAPSPAVEKKTPAQPARVAPVRQPEPAATGSDEYRTQAGDTLSSIVQQVRSEGVTSAQTMIAIQRANPRAFINDNINLLKRGQVLRIPSESEIREVSAREAIASVREQTESWRSAPAAIAPALSAQQVNATARAEKPAAPAPASDKPEMKLLGAQAGQKGGAAAAGKEQGKSAAEAGKLAENKIKADAAKTEKDALAGKVGSLGAEVKANDQQIEVQNAKLAELQAQLKAQGEQPAVAPAAPAPEATVPAEGVQTQAVEAAPAIESTPLPAKPKPPVVVQEEVVDEGLPLPLIGGAAALLALLGGGFWWTRKRRQEKEEEEAALAELEAMDDHQSGVSDELFLGDVAAQDNAWSDQPDADAGFAPVQDRVLADPIEEVEQYLAFERYPQAAGFLNKAIAASPERADLRLKLLEVYAHLDDWNGFVEQEAWFENAGDLNALAHAEELKSSLTPPARKPSRDDALPYEQQSAPAAVEDDLPSLEDLEMDFNATVSASSPALQAVQDSDLALDDDFSLELPEEAPALAADSGLSLDETLDFSFDQPSAKPVEEKDDLSFELDTAAFDNTSTDLDIQSSAADEGLDFSLDDDSSLSSSSAQSGLGDLVDFDSAPELKEPEVKTTDDDLSFSLDDLEADSASAIELEGDFSLDEQAVSTDFSFDETVQTDSGLNDAAADFDSTLRADAVTAAPAVAAAPAAASADLELDDEFDFLADTDENATKLDLARAYIDMGDMEGARDILQEVLSEGSSNQKDEAKGLLAQAG